MSYPALPPANGSESQTSGQLEVTNTEETRSDQTDEETSGSGKPDKPLRKRKVSETTSKDLPSQTTSSSKSAKQATEGVSLPSSQTPKEVEKLVEYYRDPYKWNDLGVEEDGSASDSDDDDEPRNAKDGKKSRTGKFLHHSEKMALLKLLATPPAGDTPTDPIERVRNWAPKGFTIRGKELLFVTHPDRYMGKDEKDLAQKAFQGK
jgi:hypothetical protein